MITVFFASLGCDKNLVDTEKMMALLPAPEFELTEDESEADVIVVNTCAFILDAKQESIETILDLAQMKEDGRCKSLIVTGCLAQRYQDEVKKEIPEVDVIVGTTAFDSIADVIRNAMEEKHDSKNPDDITENGVFKPLDHLPKDLTGRVRTGFAPYRYLKIAEGCNKRCTYCAIPDMRGPYRSVPMEELVKEAELLAADGAVELILVAQETTLYGVDIYGEKRLPELLHKLCAIDGIEWIRLMYCYPEEITRELIETMKNEPKVCHYLDIPIQHADDEVLRRMGRRTNQNELVEKINMIRDILPDVSIRTTLISGFPGETEAQHDACTDFVKKMHFDRLGVFPYSEEEGTPAAGFEGSIDEEERIRRADEIMKISQDVIFEKNKELIGKKLQVLVEGYLPEEGCYMGRSYRDAPEIDGLVFFESETERLTSELVCVNITEAKGYDLKGDIE